MRGHLAEGRDRLAELLALAETRAPLHPPTVARAAALGGLGSFAWRQGDYALARSLFTESLAITRRVGDSRGIALSLNNLGQVAEQEGDHAAARVFLQETLSIARNLHDRWMVAVALNNLGE